jgi:AcrR family transcriptional regulator
MSTVVPTTSTTTTRERILDAALELFIARGVAGTTVSDIERAVGLAAGTGSFYRHFHTKDELVLPAFERGVTQALFELETIRDVDVAIDDPRERAVHHCRAVLDEARHFHPLWVLAQCEHRNFPELQRTLVDALGLRDQGLVTNEIGRPSSSSVR